MSGATTPAPQFDARGHSGYSANYSHDHAAFRQNENISDWADQEPNSDDLEFDGSTEPSHHNHSNGNGHGYQRPQFDKFAHRTIILGHLADGVTHLDITEAVRGGVLLDVFVRANDRTATVSFLNSADAKAFYDHVRRHDLYIKNKRVEIRWADRHFILPGYIANKISSGATRNLVIRRCDPRHTPDSIKDDLEHIHNLIIVKVEFIGGSCYIKTNSVHNAMFARTCMMSRLKYKGSKIEWDADECAQPLPEVPNYRPRREVRQPRKAMNPMANRFQLLNLDDDDDDDDGISAFTPNKSVDIAA